MKKVTHTIYTFEGFKFEAHCGLKFHATDIDSGEVKANVIQGNATRAECRKITCPGCMNGYINQLDKFGEGIGYYDNVRNIFHDKLTEFAEGTFA